MVLPKIALILQKETLRLKGPHDASIDHSLHHFAQAAG